MTKKILVVLTLLLAIGLLVAGCQNPTRISGEDPRAASNSITNGGMTVDIGDGDKEPPIDPIEPPTEPERPGPGDIVTVSPDFKKGGYYIIWSYFKGQTPLEVRSSNDTIVSLTSSSANEEDPNVKNAYNANVYADDIASKNYRFMVVEAKKMGQATVRILGVAGEDLVFNFDITE